MQVVAAISGSEAGGVTVKGTCAAGPVCVSRCTLEEKPAGIVAGAQQAVASPGRKDRRVNLIALCLHPDNSYQCWGGSGGITLFEHISCLFHPHCCAGQQGRMKIHRMDRFGNRAAGGGSLTVSGRGPGRLDATVHDCGDGTSDVRCHTSDLFSTCMLYPQIACRGSILSFSRVASRFCRGLE